MLEYWSIERGLLLPQWVTLKRTKKRADLIHNLKLQYEGEINHFSFKKQGIVVSSKIKDASYCAYAQMEELRCAASLCIIILSVSQPTPTVVIWDIYRHEVSKSKGPTVKNNQVSFYQILSVVLKTRFVEVN